MSLRLIALTGSALLLQALLFQGMYLPPTVLINCQLILIGTCILLYRLKAILPGTLLLFLSLPCVHTWAKGANPYLIKATVFTATPLVDATGLKAHVGEATNSLPNIIAGDLTMNVVPACAGSQIYLSLLAIGSMLAGFFISSRRKQMGLILLCPCIVFTTNTLRIVLSTHAANRWLENQLDWEAAHDIISYLCFGLTYVLLCWVVFKQRDLPLGPRVAKPHPRP